MASNQKYLGIRFPFTSSGQEGFFVDMDSNPYNELKNDLTHLIFTPKGVRLRNPEFGTDLLKYIFEPTDTKTQDDIKTEIQNLVKKYFPGVTITNLSITINTDNNQRYDISIQYAINENTYLSTDTINITI